MIKRSAATVLFFVIAFTSFTQNVGIGTNTPLTKLHIFSGPSGNTTPFSPLIVESNGNTYINLLSPDANETSILFGKAENSAHGGIIYNNPSTANGFQFRTNGNTTRMSLSNAGFLGIGTSSPAAKLDVVGGNNWDLTGSEGDVRIGNGTYRLKIGIALSGGGAGGTGIMQYGSPTGYNVLALGSQGKNILRLNGNTGRAGIGTDNPGGDLEIQSNANATPQLLVRQTNAGDYGRVRITNSSGSNYWDIAGYHGATATDDRLNFFNGRNSTQFGLNGNSAFLLSGNAGSPGQVLQSNGAGAPPSWTNVSSSSMYSNTVIVSSGTEITTNQNQSRTVIPGLSYSFSTSGNAKVLISFNVWTKAIGCALCGNSMAFLQLRLNGGNIAGRYDMDLNNDRQANFSGTALISVGPGNHTIDLTAGNSGPDVRFSCTGGCVVPTNMILQIIPQ